MDDVEIAAERIEADRNALIALQLARATAHRVAPRYAPDGQRICRHCEEPIAQKRLAAVPDAVVCTECGQTEEHQARHYQRKNPWAV